MTKRCLAYLGQSYVPEDTELIIVEDGSTELLKIEDVGCLPSHFNIKCVEEDGRGFATACNAGLVEANGDEIAILNNDMYLPEDWYVGISAELAKDKAYIIDTWGKVGMVSGGLAEPPYQLEQWADSYQDFLHPSPTVTWFHKGGPWLFKRAFFSEVGVFDEQFVPAFWEEIDLLWRGVQKGWVFGITNAVVSYHLSTATILREWGPEEKARIAAMNQTKFMQKWGTINLDWYDTLKRAINEA